MSIRSTVFKMNALLQIILVLFVVGAALLIKVGFLLASTDSDKLVTIIYSIALIVVMQVSRYLMKMHHKVHVKAMADLEMEETLINLEIKVNHSRKEYCVHCRTITNQFWNVKGFDETKWHWECEDCEQEIEA